MICNSRENIIDVCHKSWKHNLCFRITETAVELDHLWSLRGLHKTAVKNTGERTALCNHCCSSRFHNLLEREFKVFISDERNRRIGTHASGVRSLVTLICTLVVLRKSHRIHIQSIHKTHERELRSCKKLLNHNLALSKLVIKKHILESFLCLFKSLRNHNTLSGSQTIILENDRE